MKNTSLVILFSLALMGCSNLPTADFQARLTCGNVDADAPSGLVDGSGKLAVGVLSVVGTVPEDIESTLHANECLAEINK
jgi:hypothetical protein